MHRWLTCAMCWSEQALLMPRRLPRLRGWTWVLVKTRSSSPHSAAADAEALAVLLRKSAGQRHQIH